MNLNSKIWGFGILSFIVEITAKFSGEVWLFLLAFACQLAAAWFVYELLRTKHRSGLLVALVSLFGIIGIIIVYLIPPKESNEPSPPGIGFPKFAAYYFLWDFFGVILIALAIIIPIRYFVFQPFIVEGSSMEPNFQSHQYLIIDELSYHLHQPQRGDVIVLRYPKDLKQFFIKRIIGLPGEKVKIDNGKVTIYNEQHQDGITLDETYLPNQGLSYPHDAILVGGSKILTLGADEYFMMGDNRLASSDSRDWGPLPRKDMVGRVFSRVLPLNEFKFYTGKVSYSL